MQFQIQAGEVVNVAAGVVLLALACWLFYLNGRSLVTFLFALLVAVRGILDVMLAWITSANLARDGATFTQLQGPQVAISLAFSLAAILFVVAYAWPRSRALIVWLGAAGLALCVAAGVLASVEPTSYQTFQPLPDGLLVSVTRGPLFLATNLPTSALVGAVCAWKAYREQKASRVGQHLLVAIGFGGYAVGLAANNLIVWYQWITGYMFPQTSPLVHDVWSDTNRLVAFGVQVALVGATVTLLAILARRHPHPTARRLARRGLVFFAGIVVALALVVAWRTTDRDAATAAGDTLSGLAQLAIPLLAGYALLRHQLFDIQVKLKWSISRGTVAAIFLGVFFIVSQLVQGFFSQGGVNWWLGAVAAGLLLFALHPIQRFAERMAETAVPGVRPVVALGPAERDAIFLRQAEMAWSDGQLSLDERSLLESLREQLGIPAEHAMKLERQAAPTGARKARPRKPSGG